MNSERGEQLPAYASTFTRASSRRLDNRRKKLLLMHEKQHLVDTMKKNLWAVSASGLLPFQQDNMRRVSMELDGLVSLKDFFQGGDSEHELPERSQNATIAPGQAEKRLQERVAKRVAQLNKEFATKATRLPDRDSSGVDIGDEERPRPASRRSDPAASALHQLDATRTSRPKRTLHAVRANARVEVLMKRQIRDQWKEINNELRRCDADNSGTLDAEEFRHVLFRFNVVLDDNHFHHLMDKIDSDHDGTVDFQEFLAFFGTGGAEDTNLGSKLRSMPVPKARALIRERIESKLGSGGGALRRAFHTFDKDRSSEISRDEFQRALKDLTMIEFEDDMFQQVFDSYDDDKSGKINFRKFCENVMESAASNRTSLIRDLDNMKQVGRVSHGSGNSTQMIKRKVRANWVELGKALARMDPTKNGVLDATKLRTLLFQFDIDMTARQWEQLITTLDGDGDGNISYGEFLRYFGNGTAEDRCMVTCITGVSVRKAKKMIQEVISSKVSGSSNGMRRAFQLLDRDRSGSISFAEFKRALREFAMLEFEEQVIETVLQEYDDDNTGEIDFRKFTTRVMGSSTRDRTSMQAGPAAHTFKHKTPLLKDARPASSSSSDIDYGLAPETGYGHHLVDEQASRLRESRRVERSLAQENETLNKKRIQRDLLAKPTSNADDINGLGLGSLMSSTNASSQQNGNTDVILHRRVRENLKDLCREFKLAADKDGTLTPSVLRRVLGGFNINIANERFRQLVNEIDDNGDGVISYGEFLTFFRGGSAQEKTFTSVAKNVTIKQAKTMIRQKVNSKVKKGRGAGALLRRQFQFFDVDGNGSIDRDELKSALGRMHLEFEEHTLQGLFNEFAGSAAEISYRAFCSQMLGHRGGASRSPASSPVSTPPEPLPFS